MSRCLSNCYVDARTGLLGVSRKVHLFSFYKGKIMDDLLFVEYSEFNARYNHRDVTARKKMKDLVDSDANKVTRVFSTLFEG